MLSYRQAPTENKKDIAADNFSSSLLVDDIMIYNKKNCYILKFFQYYNEVLDCVTWSEPS